MRSKTLLSGLPALIGLIGPLLIPGMAPAGQISVIPPPVIVTPVPVPTPPPVTASPTVSGGAGVNLGRPGGGAAGSGAGGGGAASVPVTALQSFNVATLSPGQMQVAAATIRGLLATPGAMSGAQVAVLQSQLAQMDAIMGQ